MTWTFETQAVIATRDGTGWTIDVTAANLDADLTLKDFVVLFGTTAQSVTLFTKVTRTSLRYDGASIASTTVEVRRRTPVAPAKEVRYGERFSSDDWNREMNRVSRRAAEWELFGLGSIGGVTLDPVNAAYGSVWGTDTLYAPTRQAVYNKLEAMTAERVSGDAAISALLPAFAPLVSPALTGTPTAPTPAVTANNTQLQTTAGVRQFLASGSELKTINNASVAGSTITGTTEGVTQVGNTNNLSLATTAFAHIASTVKHIYSVQQNAPLSLTNPGTALNTRVDLPGCAIAITPRSTASQFLVFATGHIQTNAANSAFEQTFLVAGSTVVDVARARNFSAGGGANFGSCALIGVVSPNTTSPVTFRVQGALESAGTLTWGQSSPVSDMWCLVVVEFANNFT